MANLAKYLVWLNWLATLGANIGPLLALLLDFYERLKPLLPPLPGQVDGGLEITQAIEDCEGSGAIATTQAMTEGGKMIVADVLEAEGKIGSLIAIPGSKTQKAFDGARLRSLFKFLNDSGILAVLMGLFSKGG